MIQFTKKNLSILNNIGDVLCTPDNYFFIESDKDIIIVGGGVWNIEKLSKDNDALKTIIWSAGRSIRFPKTSTKLPNLTFLKSGFRDILDLTDLSHFLPCVSCLNEDIIKEPKGSKTLVFTNSNEIVSHSIETKRDDWIYLTNSCSKSDFLNAWEKSDKVITNSYHGIYWSLLTGREVSPYGYSSKFTNVTALFGIDFPKDNLYDVKNRSALSSLINRDQQFTRAKNHDLKLEEFKELNINFANSLETVGVKCTMIKQ
jgi:hypothetical protein